MMKAIIPGFAITAALLTSCGNNGSPKDSTTGNNDTTNATTQTNKTAKAQPASVDEVLNSYMELKNALTNDNGIEAASAGKHLSDVLQKTDETTFSTDQRSVYKDLKDDIKEHAEHISSNGSKIAHQREHFDILSKDMYDLVKVFKPSQTIYLDHCPMYNDNKGANWLSEVKEIKNPYLGKKMPDCGTVKEEIK